MFPRVAPDVLSLDSSRRLCRWIKNAFLRRHDGPIQRCARAGTSGPCALPTILAATVNATFVEYAPAQSAGENFLCGAVEERDEALFDIFLLRLEFLNTQRQSVALDEHPDTALPRRLFILGYIKRAAGLHDRRSDRHETLMTKFKIFGAAAIVALATPTLAQDMGGGGKHRHAAQKTADQPKKKVDEKGYNAALKNIPDSKEKPDPWGHMR
jgi:hypothetical protein